MQIRNTVALVTGSGRGLGASFTEALAEAGAAKIYATARDVTTITDPRLTPLVLDITDQESVRAAAAVAQDVTLVINNAGIHTGTEVLGQADGLRQELESNYLGPLSVAREFAPILKRNGGGALVNCLSILSWYVITRHGGYSASKAAMWSATNALRLELDKQNTLVTGIYMAYLDTDMFRDLDVPKTSPDVVAQLALAGIEADEHEVFCDDITRSVHAGLSGPVAGLYPELAG